MVDPDTARLLSDAISGKNDGPAALERTLAMSEAAWAENPNWAQETSANKYNAEQRRQAAKTGAALSDGSFPIYNQQDAMDAMNDLGRTKHPRAMVETHIRKRVGQLGLKMPPSLQGKSGSGGGG